MNKFYLAELSEDTLLKKNNQLAELSLLTQAYQEYIGHSNSEKESNHAKEELMNLNFSETKNSIVLDFNKAKRQFADDYKKVMLYSSMIDKNYLLISALKSANNSTESIANLEAERKVLEFKTKKLTYLVDCYITQSYLFMLMGF